MTIHLSWRQPLVVKYRDREVKFRVELRSTKRHWIFFLEDEMLPSSKKLLSEVLEVHYDKKKKILKLSPFNAISREIVASLDEALKANKTGWLDGQKSK